MKSMIVAGLLTVVLSGCGGGTDDASKFDQTWPKDYSSTTCGEWGGSLSEHERFVAAADMLTGARNKGDGGVGLPPDSLIDEFEGGIDTACVIPTANIAEIAVGVYLTEPRFKP